MYYILSRYGGRTLVFTNSIDAARRLYNLLGKLKRQPTPLILHAKMQESKRLKNLEKFTGLNYLMYISLLKKKRSHHVDETMKLQ